MLHVLMQNTEQKLVDLVHFYHPATTYVDAIYRFIVFSRAVGITILDKKLWKFCEKNSNYKHVKPTVNLHSCIIFLNCFLSQVNFISMVSFTKK